MTATARQRLRPVLPGRLTRPRVARRGRVPGGARSTGRLGRISGSREQSAPFLAHMLRHFRSLVAKTTAPTFVATKWRACPFCFLGWHHRNGSQAARVASLGNSESGGLATRECSWNVWDKGSRLPTCKKLAAGLPGVIARMNKKEGHHAADETDKTSVRWGSGLSAR